MRQPVYEVEALNQCNAHIYIPACTDLENAQSRLASMQWEAAIQPLLLAPVLQC